VTEISRVALFGKLNPIGLEAIEGATGFCKLRGNPYVELVHWIHQILQLPDSDLHRIVKHFSLKPSTLAHDITESLDRLPRGSTSILDLSSHVEETVERGWVYGSLMFNEYQVRTGHLVVGMLKTPGLGNALAGISKEFKKIKVETLIERWTEIVGSSPEAGMVAQDMARMAGISRAALFGKLNPIGYTAIERATMLCKLQGNPYVELVHWMHQILELPDSDLHRIVLHFGLEPSRLAHDITESLERLPRGAASISDLSVHVEEAVERGWVYGSQFFQEDQVRTGHLVVGILKAPRLRHALAGISKEFAKVKVENLMERWAEIVGDSPEERMAAQDGTTAVAGGARPRRKWAAGSARTLHGGPDRPGRPGKGGPKRPR